MCNQKKYNCCHCGGVNHLTKEQTETNERIIVPVEGEPGENGYTPYIGTNDNWWVNGVDLGVPAVGQPGETPYIGVNGNWWIGDVDTGVLAGGGSDSPESATNLFY